MLLRPGRQRATRWQPRIADPETRGIAICEGAHSHIRPCVGLTADEAIINVAGKMSREPVTVPQAHSIYCRGASMAELRDHVLSCRLLRIDIPQREETDVHSKLLYAGCGGLVSGCSCPGGPGVGIHGNAGWREALLPRTRHRSKYCATSVTTWPDEYQVTLVAFVDVWSGLCRYRCKQVRATTACTVSVPHCPRNSDPLCWDCAPKA
jgi:hypothetical protein